jgi:hypothetical protein
MCPYHLFKLFHLPREGRLDGRRRMCMKIAMSIETAALESCTKIHGMTYYPFQGLATLTGRRLQLAIDTGLSSIGPNYIKAGWIVAPQNT